MQLPLHLAKSTKTSRCLGSIRCCYEGRDPRDSMIISYSPKFNGKSGGRRRATPRLPRSNSHFKIRHYATPFLFDNTVWFGLYNSHFYFIKQWLEIFPIWWTDNCWEECLHVVSFCYYAHHLSAYCDSLSFKSRVTSLELWKWSVSLSRSRAFLSKMDVVMTPFIIIFHVLQLKAKFFATILIVFLYLIVNKCLLQHNTNLCS